MKVIITKHAENQIRERLNTSPKTVEHCIQTVAHTLEDRCETHLILAELDRPARAKDGSKGYRVVAACHRKGRKVIVATVMYRWAWQLR